MTLPKQNFIGHENYSLCSTEAGSISDTSLNYAKLFDESHSRLQRSVLNWLIDSTGNRPTGTLNFRNMLNADKHHTTHLPLLPSYYCAPGIPIKGTMHWDNVCSTINHVVIKCRSLWLIQGIRQMQRGIPQSFIIISHLDWVQVINWFPEWIKPQSEISHCSFLIRQASGHSLQVITCE